MCTDLAQRLLVDFSQPGRCIPRVNEVHTVKHTIRTQRFNNLPAENIWHSKLPPKIRTSSACQRITGFYTKENHSSFEFGLLTKKTHVHNYVCFDLHFLFWIFTRKCVFYNRHYLKIIVLSSQPCREKIKNIKIYKYTTSGKYM